MECDFGNAVACLPQPQNWLENEKGKDNKVFGGVWKAVETEVKGAKISEVKEKEKEEEKIKNDGSKEDGREMGNLEWRGRSSKVRERG